MKNKLTRKLMLSAFTLLFAVISLGASTYAWFVLSEDAQVKAFQGTVQAGESGLEIAVGKVDGTGEKVWRSTELDLAADFAAATTVKFGALQNNKDSNTFDPTKFTKYNGAAGTENGDYVAFRLYFRLADTTGLSNDDTETVYLTDYDLTTVDSTVNAWYVNKAYTGITGAVGVGEENVIYYVSDAARIAFKTTTASNVYEAEELRGGANFSSYGIGTKDSVKGAHSYYNNVNDDKLVYPTSYYSASHSSDVSLEIGELTKAANETYVDVYVWVDGWDQECINAIFNQTLQILLKFSLNSTAQEAE